MTTAVATVALQEHRVYKRAGCFNLTAVIPVQTDRASKGGISSGKPNKFSKALLSCHTHRSLKLRSPTCSCLASSPPHDPVRQRNLAHQSCG